MKILTLYFSGTGNTRYVAQSFSQKMAAPCHSIEDAVNFAEAIAAADTVALCYPIYGSRAPFIMRQFVAQHLAAFAGKKLIIFVTQTLFSGDGARAITDLFPANHVQVIYAEHFFMPNNISNIFFLRKASAASITRRARRADKKLDKVCRNIKEGIIKRRGFSALSKLIGKLQGIPWQGNSRQVAAAKRSMEHRAMRKVKIGAGCTHCGICVTCCPMRNFQAAQGTITPLDNCTICYRCINRCPQKVISVWFNAKPKWQYRGMK
ncbi:MAG: EFR1 family ferrodoxin [Defluviitaleaceae bacterium]|nr:EFR1 family ferrodoxin [Defluviitaleaceae bacterium]